MKKMCQRVALSLEAQTMITELEFKSLASQGFNRIP